MEKLSNWHPEVIPPEGQRLLASLRTEFFPSTFYLAGGTGLALRFGHRRSVDFDFFSRDTFDEETLLASTREYSPMVLSRAPQTLHLILQGIKVSFIGYPSIRCSSRPTASPPSKWRMPGTSLA